MTTCSSHLKLSAVIILMVNSFCALSKFDHEFLIITGCFYNGTTEVQFEFDAEEILYADFERHSLVYTLPAFILLDPRTVFDAEHEYRNALKSKRACAALMTYYTAEEKDPQEDKDPPDSILYPAEEVQLGVENRLICFFNHFYPPSIKVSWTKNNNPVSEGVVLSRYYPNSDRTFHQFSTLTFTPSKGDIYSCTVEHAALESPKTRIWDHDFSHQSFGRSLDVFCGVGLALGFLGVATGTFLIVKGLQNST